MLLLSNNNVQETVSQIDINYETNNNNVSFKLKFGKGKDSYIVPNSKERTNYSEQYNIEVYESDDNKGYRILCDDSPLVVDISNININGKQNYDYALGFAVDNHNQYEYIRKNQLFQIILKEMEQCGLYQVISILVINLIKIQMQNINGKQKKHAKLVINQQKKKKNLV